MPIKIPNALPATETLLGENIFVITETRALTQDIRPLQIALLNLMPTKIVTETQFARLLGNTPLQVELTLLHTSTHEAKNVSPEHLLSFYKTFEDVKDERFDGLIITGAPVEHLKFEEVEYWDELCKIMEWSKTHVHSTFHVCWGAQAGLYYHFGVEKHPLDKKLFGVFHLALVIVEHAQAAAPLDVLKQAFVIFPLAQHARRHIRRWAHSGRLHGGIHQFHHAVHKRGTVAQQHVHFLLF